MDQMIVRVCPQVKNGDVQRPATGENIAEKNQHHDTLN